ncbi:hypothetical protein NLJ89_g10712 [Agrocybe chaxingu]|uniref:Histone deacetylase domain-containing protein n=1 Tax=Agrocybe chaxingu TaxID=84603 RepID=A0A9W8JQ29_9AGAR|nr:hypothetical protein NLJ89_g10712 [Agrocybe chaxingu]
MSSSNSSTEERKSPLKKSAIFLQNACLQHRYIRSKDLSTIVERPERLRAVTLGLSAAIARLEALFPATRVSTDVNGELDPADLANAMNKLKINSDSLVEIIQSETTTNLLNHPAVKYIHGDIERDIYLENLTTWAKESHDKIAKGDSEIPHGYSQGDLYLCPGSIAAIEGAVGTVCEAVDRVVGGDTPNAMHRAFVGIRPPGHHCGEDTPSGFCFVNNVAIAAAHAHLQHGIKRIVIFDIDLHHGGFIRFSRWNNFDGIIELVQAASVSLHKSHGQHIENVHLQTYTSEEHFWNVLYKEQYSRLLTKAKEFLDHTGGPGDDILIFISCGMDACEHEYESMSRHNRKVPTSFYYRFARDACALSDKYARGRIISVLEGGYSDRALTSGAMAHLSGLVDVPAGAKVDEDWWNVDNLIQVS